MFHENILKQAKANQYFRKVLVTGKHSQVVLMSIEVNEDIGLETHKEVDQIIIIADGKCKVLLNGEESIASEGFLVFVQAGTKHNFINIDNKPLKLFTVYAPAQHKDGTIHKTKADAENEEELY